LNAPTKGYFSRISPKKGTLGVIVRTFKAAVTSIARQRGFDPSESIWQRNYYDHIIRSDVSHFFITQYIEINPIMWAFDRDNPAEPQISIKELSRILETQYNITGERLESIIEQEVDYKNWFDTTEQE
jgi:hypothetical protein